MALSGGHRTRLEVARAYALSRLGWFRDRQEKLLAQPRETPRQFVERESHYLWGRRHYPTWREARTELNALLPLAAEAWS